MEPKCKTEMILDMAVAVMDCYNASRRGDDQFDERVALYSEVKLHATAAVEAEMMLERSDLLYELSEAVADSITQSPHKAPSADHWVAWIQANHPD